jgi:hypothetical protein
MERSCPLAALFAALAQSGHSKATSSKATKRGVGLGGKPGCDCVTQQNDPFVLRSQPCRRGNAAYSWIPQAIPLPRSRLPALRCGAVHSRCSEHQMWLVKSHSGCGSVTVTDTPWLVTPRPRSSDTMTRRLVRVVSLMFDRHVIAGDIGHRAHRDAEPCPANSKNDRSVRS